MTPFMDENFLLRNEPAPDSRPPLPLRRDQKIALIGPYADSQDIVGMWAIHAVRDPVVTVKRAFGERLGEGGGGHHQNHSQNHANNLFHSHSPFAFGLYFQVHF